MGNGGGGGGGSRRHASSRTRLSRSAAQLEARALLSVVHGIRCAALISTFATNHFNVAALSTLLRRHSGDVFLLVHVASEQTFVVHRGILRRRLEGDGDRNCADTVFLPVDQLVISQDAETIMPVQLSGMLRTMKGAINGPGGNAAIILLHGAIDDVDLQSVAIAGVPLAGWLLEYPAAYYFRTAHCRHPRAILVREIEDLQSMMELGGSYDSEYVSGNNLAGKPLTIFSVLLRSPESGAETLLTQFTIPAAQVASVAGALRLQGDQAASIARRLEGRILERTRRVDQALLPPDASVYVDMAERIMDRFAL